MTNGVGSYDDAIDTHYSTRTIVYEAPCPNCEREVTWFAHPAKPWGEPRCPRPTCNTNRVVER